MRCKRERDFLSLSFFLPQSPHTHTHTDTHANSPHTHILTHIPFVENNQSEGESERESRRGKGASAVFFRSHTHIHTHTHTLSFFSFLRLLSSVLFHSSPPPSFIAHSHRHRRTLRLSRCFSPICPLSPSFEKAVFFLLPCITRALYFTQRRPQQP